MSRRPGLMRAIAATASSKDFPVLAAIFRALFHTRSVAANPGQMALTVTPLPATSAASARVRPTSACLEAVYAVTYGAPWSPATEAMLITHPHPLASIAGKTARVNRYVPAALARERPCGGA